MAGALAAASVVTACGDVLLLVICSRSRTALGAVLGAVGIGLVVFAIASGLGSNTAAASIVIAFILLVLGTALYALGRVFERLLDADPEDES